MILITIKYNCLAQQICDDVELIQKIKRSSKFIHYTIEEREKRWLPVE